MSARKSINDVLPSDLTSRQREDLKAMLAIGTPERDACWAVGLHPSILARWKSQPWVEGDLVCEFVAELYGSVGRGVAQQVKTVYKGTEKDKSLNARWWLSRVRPQEFGANQPQTNIMISQHQSQGLSEEGEEERLRQSLAVLEAEGVVISDKLRETVLGEKVAPSDGSDEIEGSTGPSEE